MDILNCSGYICELKHAFLFTGLKRKPQNAEFVINTCGQYIVDSRQLKQKQDAIQEILEHNIGQGSGDKNVANDVRKYLTFFLRGWVPVVLEDKEELLKLVLRKAAGAPKIRKRKKTGGEAGSGVVHNKENAEKVKLLEANTEKLAAELMAARSEADELRVSVQGLREDSEESLGKLVALEAELMAARSEADGLRQLVQGLRADSMESSGKLVAVEAELMAARSEADALRKSVEGVQGAREAWAEKLVAAEAELTAVRAEGSELRQTLEALEQKMETVSRAETEASELAKRSQEREGKLARKLGRVKKELEEVTKARVYVEAL
jgi:predicted  nucleic acid-binding Zn-ribbon protein